TSHDGAPLESTFVSVAEPWKTAPLLASVKRIEAKTADGAVLGDSDVALEITLPDGQRDLFLIRDPISWKNSPAATCGEDALVTDGHLALLRISADGLVYHAAIATGERVSFNNFLLLASGATGNGEFNAE